MIVEQTQTNEPITEPTTEPTPEPTTDVELDKFGRLLFDGRRITEEELIPLVMSPTREEYRPDWVPDPIAVIAPAVASVAQSKHRPEYAAARQWMLYLAFYQSVYAVVGLFARAPLSGGLLGMAKLVVPVVIWFGFWAQTQSTFVSKFVLEFAILGVAASMGLEVVDLASFTIAQQVVVAVSLAVRVLAVVAFLQARKTSNDRRRTGW